MVGATVGVLVGATFCAALHWVFADAATAGALDVVIVSVCGIVGMGLDVLGHTKRDDE